MHPLKEYRRAQNDETWTVHERDYFLFALGFSKGINGWKLHAQNACLREAARLEATRSSAAEGNMLTKSHEHARVSQASSIII